MNKYQEALEYITPRLKDYRTVKEDKFELQYNNKVSNDYNAIQAIKELVRKENSVKPHYEIHYPSALCPECFSNLGDNKRYCSGCGQRIDWSGGDEE